MPSTEPLDPAERLAALKDLRESEGWKAFKAHVEESWGAQATLNRITGAVAKVELGNQPAVADVTQHVLTAQRHILALIAWPDEEVAKLTRAPKQRPYEGLRRA